MTISPTEHEIPKGPDCLCAWYEHCEVCSPANWPPSPPLTLDDYKRSISIPADALNTELPEIARQLIEAASAARHHFLNRLFFGQ